MRCDRGNVKCTVKTVREYICPSAFEWTRSPVVFSRGGQQTDRDPREFESIATPFPYSI